MAHISDEDVHAVVLAAVAGERERIAKFIEGMDDGPLTTKAVKSWIAREIRNIKSEASALDE